MPAAGSEDRDGIGQDTGQGLDIVRELGNQEEHRQFSLIDVQLVLEQEPERQIRHAVPDVGEEPTSANEEPEASVGANARVWTGWRGGFYECVGHLRMRRTRRVRE